jgi:pyruvate ferredoxin oxidoreductase gamma subunit
MSQMIEIRWHGRGGQGVVTAGETLGEAAMSGGRYIQSFPEYGSERMGAPIKSYTRISDEPIEFHCPVLEPDMVIVVNPNLVGVIDLTEGLKPEGALLVNTPGTPQQIRERLGFHTGRVFCVDASKIAMEELKRDIPSTMMLGVVARVSDLITLDDAIHAARERLGEKLRPEVIEANVRSLRRTYEECVEG